MRFFHSRLVGDHVRFDAWLAAPTLVWLAGFIASLVYFVPKVRALLLAHSRVHTELVGHVNDVYSNIGLVKLFGREEEETAANLTELNRHSASFHAALHKIWQMGATQTAMNVALLLASPLVALAQWQAGRIASGTVIMIVPMAWQMVNMSGWIRNEVTHVFETLSKVEECMETITKPYSVLDAPGARRTQGAGDGKVEFSASASITAAPQDGRRQSVIENLSCHPRRAKGRADRA